MSVYTLTDAPGLVHRSHDSGPVKPSTARGLSQGLCSRERTCCSSPDTRLAADPGGQLEKHFLYLGGGARVSSKLLTRMVKIAHHSLMMGNYSVDQSKLSRASISIGNSILRQDTKGPDAEEDIRQMNRDRQRMAERRSSSPTSSGSAGKPGKGVESCQLVVTGSVLSWP